MIETIEQKKRRLFGRQYLEEYLKIIHKITIIKNPKIISIVETDRINNNQNKLNNSFSIKLLFNNKSDLKNIILKQFKSKDTVYLFIPLSEDCGAIEMDSIINFNFNFNFTDEPSGIISIISKNLKEKILLDFYEEQEVKYIEFEYYS
ncbi:hypothetical protein [Empedobacter tilapiae]|uniref:Uncharacterized protein n=1 Tax=Empedobacter tilapiae TaxID=2491114 RepID=A0A4Z1CC51_9FLAO|nr:hypothetical protein [Empedobacter tilapiae]TGN30004.1 hypothetical protein E4J94_00025 [Empedobacter tilapiae]